VHSVTSGVVHSLGDASSASERDDCSLDEYADTLDAAVDSLEDHVAKDPAEIMRCPGVILGCSSVTFTVTSGSSTSIWSKLPRISSMASDVVSLDFFEFVRGSRSHGC
jgi:hypothetical protein